MFNPEHLAILEKGVEVWNRWRKSDPTVNADLSDANLGLANRSGADLSKASWSFRVSLR